jgi:hypothetical protein
MKNRLPSPRRTTGGQAAVEKHALPATPKKPRRQAIFPINQFFSWGNSFCSSLKTRNNSKCHNRMMGVVFTYTTCCGWPVFRQNRIPFDSMENMPRDLWRIEDGRDMFQVAGGEKYACCSLPIEIYYILSTGSPMFRAEKNTVLSVSC